jgi:hypothetical protein
MSKSIDFLTSIRDSRQKILELKNNIYDRQRTLYTQHAASQESVELALIDVLEANIQLAQAEIDLLKNQE